MAGGPFTEILRRAYQTGRTPDRVDSREWFRAQAQKVRSVNVQRLVLDPRATQTLVPGKMYHYFYDPKHKDTLPYYDRFPLIFPFRLLEGGFMGINLHYLPYPARARLMDALYSLEDRRYREDKRLRLSYEILNSAARFSYFKPCVKRYLNGHVRSQFLPIPSEQWEIALFLPTERFMKESKQDVWKDSMDKL